MGRKPTRFELRLPPELADRIDDWRRVQTDLPPRAEAARRLIEIALACENAALANQATAHRRMTATLNGTEENDE